MTEHDVKQMYAMVEANSKLLESCDAHIFEDQTPAKDRAFKRYKCTRCNGLVDATAHHFYLKGLTHAHAHYQDQNKTPNQTAPEPGQAGPSLPS